MRLLLSFLPLAALGLTQDFQVPFDDDSIQPIQHPLSESALSILGFGTWRLGENTTQAVSWAIQTGYRHIDCAAAYGNEREVGEGIRDGLAKTGLTRDDLWITSKLWNDHHDPASVAKAINGSIEKLGVGYLNLYLMHWPVAHTVLDVNIIDYLDTWEAMEDLVDAGKTRYIGVANFSPHQIKQLLKHYKTHPPQVHQMELHPYLQQSSFVKWHQDLGIHVTAYSPFAGTNPVYGPGDDDTPTPLLNNTVLKDIADDRDCTPAQVAVMWSLTRGTSVIPKATSQKHIHENFYSLECILEEEDLDKLEDLHKVRYRYSNPSKKWDVLLFEDLEDSLGEHKKHS